MNLPQANAASFRRPDIVDEPLYVITPVFNPQRYRSRWKYYKQFEKHVLDAGAHLILIEATFGEREEVFTEEVSPKHTVIHVQVSHLSEIWLKENLINIAISRLPKGWKYVAWIDADIQFVRPDWVGETLHQLQHYHIVQMFSVALDVDINYNTYCINYGFVYDIGLGYVPGKTHVGSGGNNTPSKPYPTSHLHTGFAWAARKEAIVSLGGLMEFCILGSADNHMSKALFGYVETSLNKGLSEEYKYLCREWEKKALHHIQKNVGYVSGTVNHFFHGAKRHRRYKDRWKILIENQYRPYTDIQKDWNGVLRLTGNKPELRDDCRNYFRQRNEDSIDL